MKDTVVKSSLFKRHNGAENCDIWLNELHLYSPYRRERAIIVESMIAMSI